MSENFPLIQTDNPWIQTLSGTKFYPFSPTPDMVLIKDIVGSLAKKCRFNGHCLEFVSVAEHSVMVFDIMLNELKITDPMLLLQGLLHDAGEAYLCDVPSPIKHRLVGFQGHENAILDVVMAKFGVPTQGGALDENIHYADKRAGIYEFSQNMELSPYCKEGTHDLNLKEVREQLGFDLIPYEEIPAWGQLKYRVPEVGGRVMNSVLAGILSRVLDTAEV